MQHNHTLDSSGAASSEVGQRFHPFLDGEVHIQQPVLQGTAEWIIF